jgi:hypothetical protein
MMAEKMQQKGTGLWSFAALVLTFPLFLLFNHFGEPANGRAAWFSAGMILIAVKVRWELRKHVWFWTTLAVIVALHVPLILFVPWTGKWVPAFVILPFCFIDIIVILALIHLVEKQMKPSQSPDDPDVSNDLKADG